MERIKPGKKPRVNRGSKRGHGKGADFERQTCRDLSLFVTNGKRKDCFWRSAMSGGRATVQGKKGILNLSQAGDISAISSEGLKFIDTFTVECKFYKSLEIESGLLFGRGALAGFWRELLKLTAKTGKAPLLIAKQNFTPTLVLTSFKGYVKLPGSNAGAALSYALGSLELPVYVLLYDRLFGKHR